jgi:hypothetical protein
MLFSLNSSLSIWLDPSMLWILKLSKSTNRLNRSSVNCGAVSVGTGVIIRTFSLFLVANCLIIIPPIIKVFPLRHLQPHKNDLFPFSIKSLVFWVIISWWNLRLSFSLIFWKIDEYGKCIPILNRTKYLSKSFLSRIRFYFMYFVM